VGPEGLTSEEAVKILIADDEPTILSLLRNVLEERKDCTLTLASDGEDALRKLRQTEPDLLITDLKMPRMGGEDLTRQALAVRPDLTVIILTGNGTLENAVRLMKEGVFDYVTKPFQVTDFMGAVDRAIGRVRSAFLSGDSQAILGSLMKALETKDAYLKNHSGRVADLAQKLCLDLGLDRKKALLVKRAALAHDLGKIGIPETILNKPGPLTEEEYCQVKKHPGYSVEIVRPLKEFQGCLRDIYHHHEHFDGKGYPDGISGDDIPLGGRIIAVCDAFDAMASDRSYRKALPQAAVLAVLREGRGHQFDPNITDEFMKRFAG